MIGGYLKSLTGRIYNQETSMSRNLVYVGVDVDVDVDVDDDDDDDDV